MPDVDANEQTPLLLARPVARDRGQTLLRYVDPLVHQLRTEGAIEVGPDALLSINSPHEEAELTILLLAVQELTRSYLESSESGNDITHRLAEDRARVRGIRRLDAEIKKRLDAINCGDDELRELLWRRWPVNNEVAVSGEPYMLSFEIMY